MTIAISRYGMSVTYTCRNFKLKDGKKCPDFNVKCFHCKYCHAQMSGHDATRLLDSFGRKHPDAGSE